jgi:signal transduction histidine kinase
VAPSATVLLATSSGVPVERTRGPASRLWQRLVPSTMGARLVLTAGLIAFVTAAVTLGINAALVNARAEAWTRSDAVASLQGFRSFLSLEGQGINVPVKQISGDSAFRSLYAASNASQLQRQFGMRLLQETEATALVGVASNGRILLSSGADADLAALRAIAARSGSHETTGLVRLSGGTALVCYTPVLAPDGSRSVGYLIAARLLDPARLARFDAMMRTVRAGLHEPGYRPAGVALHRLPADGSTMYYGADGAVVVMIGDLSGAGGGVAGTVELRDVDPRGARASSTATESAVLGAAAAALIGLGLGLWLAGIMRRPIGRMIRQMRRRAEAAAKGDAGADVPGVTDPVLPVEFQELAAVIEDLIRGLDVGRADLLKATRVAESAEEILGVVVNESREAKIVLQDDRVVVANPAAAEAVGALLADLIGHTATSALSGVTILGEDGVELTGADLVACAMEARTTVAMVLPDGSQRWYAVDAVSHIDDRRERVLLTARDVTEERRIATIRTEIISLVGHDLRSPLTVVIGYLDLMTRPMTEEERARAIGAARRNAARMADLLEDLLSATRAEELLAPSDLVPTSLSALAEEVVASLGPTHSDRPLLLEQQCDPIVLGEEKRLRQVLVNLVTNAYKYTPDPEPILVRIRCDEKSAYLEVVDHGPGIPAEDRDHVFERFARLNTGERRPGAGLGLYIVNIIARNHGGSAHVEETPGGGATFVITLPLVGTMVDGEFVL